MHTIFRRMRAIFMIQRLGRHNNLTLFCSCYFHYETSIWCCSIEQLSSEILSIYWNCFHHIKYVLPIYIYILSFRHPILRALFSHSCTQYWHFAFSSQHQFIECEYRWIFFFFAQRSKILFGKIKSFSCWKRYIFSKNWRLMKYLANLASSIFYDWF